MIRITDKSLCCGCTACVSACPVQCIVMRRDDEGFDYPVANADLCVGCGRCEEVCPVITPPKETVPLDVLAARSEDHVSCSSSGGVFPVLAEAILDAGGKVYGAVFEDDFKVGHAEAACKSEMLPMRGSKYVQSDLYSTFDDVKECLLEGRKALFTGTPCQVAGLLGYLGNRPEGLLTVDFACHGVSCPGLWDKYVKALEKKKEGPLESVSFRDKSKGWRHYNFRYDEVKVSYTDDPYMALFVQDVTLRPSCYRCRMRAGRTVSDLTLADLWNVSAAAPEFDDDRGVSSVFVNTVAGKEALSEVAVRLSTSRISRELAMGDNGGFHNPVSVPERREEFFNSLYSAKDLIHYMKGYVVRRPLHQRIYRMVRGFLAYVKRRIIG